MHGVVHTCYLLIITIIICTMGMSRTYQSRRNCFNAVYMNSWFPRNHVDYLLLIYICCIVRLNGWIHVIAPAFNYRSFRRYLSRVEVQLLNLSRGKFYLKEIVYERVTCIFDVIKFWIQTSSSSGWFKRYFVWYRILIPLMGIVIKFSSFCRFACRHASSTRYEIIKDSIAIICKY